MLDELIKNAKNVKGNILTLGFANNSKLVQTINNNKKVNNIITLTTTDDKLYIDLFYQKMPPSTSFAESGTFFSVVRI